MDTVKSKIEIDNNIIYPETDAECIKYNNTNAKSFMEGVLSTANLSQAVQTLFKSNNYSDACRALKVAPEKYFDESFNTWNPTNSPDVSGGALIMVGSQGLDVANKLNLIGDISIQCKFHTDQTSALAVLFAIYLSTTYFISFSIVATGQLQITVRKASNNQKVFTYPVSIGSIYSVELSYDSDSNYWYFFVDGSLIDSVEYAYAGGAHTFRIGGHNTAFNFKGSLYEMRLSNIARHTTSHTATDSDYFTYDDNTISLLHFD